MKFGILTGALVLCSFGVIQKIEGRPQFGLQESFFNPISEKVGQGEKVAEGVIDDLACITLGLGKKCNQPQKKEVEEEVIVPAKAPQDTLATNSSASNTTSDNATTMPAPSETTPSSNSPSSSSEGVAETTTPSSISSSSSAGPNEGTMTTLPSDNAFSSTTPSSSDASSSTEGDRNAKNLMDGGDKSGKAGGDDFTDFQQLALDLHNRLRANHLSSNLVLNKTMNEMAQTWAEKLLKDGKLTASPASARSYSEQLFKISGGEKITDKEAVESGIEAWYKSQRWFNHEKPKATGFSQIVWKDTTQLGVGLASSGDAAYLVATYYPRGNIVVVGSDAETLAKFKKNVSPLIDNPHKVFP